ncbi:MAG: TerB family tellurite resistance protein [Deltaproteobacteria bacterium]|nr:TerB family tellurite resistance protein [Deltaproteobacteria bacterium]
MGFTFSVESASLPPFAEVVGAASLGEPLQLAGAGWTGESWPKGLFAKVADAAAVAATMELTPDIEAAFERAGLSGVFLAFLRGSARGVTVTRTGRGVTFGVLALSSAADYDVAAKLAAATARLARSSVIAGVEGGAPPEVVAADQVLSRFDRTFGETNAALMGTWLAEDAAEGRTYFFQGPRGWAKLGPDDFAGVAKADRFSRACTLLLGDAAPAQVSPSDPRRDAVLLTAAMMFAAGADGRLDEEEARQLEAHFATIRELRSHEPRALLDAARAEVPGLEALRGLATPSLRKKAFVLAGEVIASARGGKLTGDAEDPNVKAVSALVSALGLEGDQAFVARVVRTVMGKYATNATNQVDDDAAGALALGMMLAAAADGHVDAEESALLAALAKTVPELRGRDVGGLFDAARSRMSGGVDAALADLAGRDVLREKAFALAAEVALVAGRGPQGTMLPRLQETLRPDPDYAECAIATFAAKYSSA